MSLIWERSGFPYFSSQTTNACCFTPCSMEARAHIPTSVCWLHPSEVPGWVMAVVTQQWGLAGLLLGTDMWILLWESREPQGAAPAVLLLACQGRFTDLTFELQHQWCTAGAARGLPASSGLRRDNLEACQQSNLEKGVNLGRNEKGKCKWRKPAACIDCAGIWPWV